MELKPAISWQERKKKLNINQDGSRFGNIHHTPLALHCDYLPFHPDFDYSPYDFLIFFLQGGRGKRCVEYMRTIKSRYNGMIAYLWGEIYRLGRGQLFLQHFGNSGWVQIMKIVDIIASSFDAYETEWAHVWEKLGKPFYLYPLPYDGRSIRKRHQKIQPCIDTGVYAMAHGRLTDVRRELKVMARLQKEFEIKCTMNRNLYITEEALEKQRAEVASNLDLTVIDRIMDFEEFMEKLANWFLIIDGYACYSCSNFTIHSALVGTPVVSHTYNTAAKICFPETTFKIDDLDGWVSGAERLIKDRTFYNNVSKTGVEVALTKFSYGAFRKRWYKIYEDWLRKK
jgi:hypothetical protein